MFNLFIGLFIKEEHEYSNIKCDVHIDEKYNGKIISTNLSQLICNIHHENGGTRPSEHIKTNVSGMDDKTIAKVNTGKQGVLCALLPRAP